MKKLESNTKTLVLAILFNIFILPLVPLLISFVALEIVQANVDALTENQLELWVSIIKDGVTLLVQGALVAFSIIWAAKWFTYEAVPLAKKRWAHILWIVVLCVVSGLAGFTVWSSILS